MIESGLSVHLQQHSPIYLDVEFTCASGEVLALVGPSGSGKTTVLRCIAGLYHPLQGQISCPDVWFDSNREIRLSAQHRRVGMVFQSYALFPHLTALENVMLALGHLPSEKRSAKARELLSKVHLEGLYDRHPDTLSGGQQQRVALARALARDPKVLLLDEPFSAVDQVTRRKLRLELAALTRTVNIPVVLVTHDLDEAVMLADRLCVMHAGHTLQSGVPEAVMNRPNNATVARLMDVLNLFEGKILEHLPQRRLTRLQWQGHVLEIGLNERFPLNSKVHWMIPAGSVLLHRRRYPSNGDRENPVSGRIIELLTLSGLSTVIMQVEGMNHIHLTLELSPHVVKRNFLSIGEAISVSIVGEAVHLMPWQAMNKHRQVAKEADFS